MLVVNFTHPLTRLQRETLERLTECEIERVVQCTVHFDHRQPFDQQTKALVDGVGMSREEWQTKRLLLVPPSLASIACCVLAEVHGRSGYFPPFVRLRPVVDRVPPEFEVAELVNLQDIRDAARSLRGGAR